MRFNRAFRIRCALCGAALLALGLAFVRISSLSAGQAAVSLSRPGQEDLTFWVNHNGLSELDVEGEVGFGDMARILMRRRSNSERMRALRDRFTFRVHEMAALDTPDQFRVELSDDGLTWLNQPKEIVVTRGRIFNLPVVIHNRGSRSAQITLGYGSDAPVSAAVPAGSTAGYFLKVIENSPGVHVGRVSVRFDGGQPAEAPLRVDVRPPATLRPPPNGRRPGSTMRRASPRTAANGPSDGARGDRVTSVFKSGLAGVPRRAARGRHPLNPTAPGAPAPLRDTAPRVDTTRPGDACHDAERTGRASGAATSRWQPGWCR